MKCLLVPIGFISKNLSNISLVKALARVFDDVAICGSNEYEIEGITHFSLAKPKLSNYKLAQNNNADINSFDDFLYRYGLLDKKYLIDEIEAISEAIDEYKPDIVYAHDNISAIIAANLFNIPCFASYSNFINRQNINTRAIRSINKVLSHYQMAQILNMAELYDLTCHKFVYNLPRLEPIDSDNITYVGKFLTDLSSTYENSIVINLPNSMINEKKQLKVIKDTFMNSSYQVEMFGTKYPGNYANVHVSENMMLHSALSNAIVFIHDGSDNNIDLALQYKVGQIIITNNFLKHSYNSEYMVEENCAFRLSKSLFNVKYLYESFKALVDNPKYINNLNNLHNEFCIDTKNIILESISSCIEKSREN